MREGLAGTPVTRRSVIVDETSTEVRLAPGIVYSLQCSTNSCYFVYSVFSVAQLGLNWALVI
jgi:hypothetical protein